MTTTPPREPDQLDELKEYCKLLAGAIGSTRHAAATVNRYPQSVTSQRYWEKMVREQHGLEVALYQLLGERIEARS